MEALKIELFNSIKKGENAEKLFEAQEAILSDMKVKVAKKLAEVTVKKSSRIKRFFGFTITEEGRDGLEQIEALQAELRVISSYEEYLKVLTNTGNIARLNLDTLNNRV